VTLMDRNKLILHIEQLYASGIWIIKQKNRDYCGQQDTADVFANFRIAEMFGVPVETGILIRLGDKIARINNLLKHYSRAVENEAIEDTIIDAINYLALLHAYLAGGKRDTEGKTDAVQPE
jgi:hypothetical protein